MSGRKWAWFVLGMAATAVIVILVYAVLRGASQTNDIRSTQQTNVPKIDNTAETLKLVKDCVTPGGKCYQRGQNQTSSAVGNINRVIVYAAACADRPGEQTVEQIQGCVIARLAADQHR